MKKQSRARRRAKAKPAKLAKPKPSQTPEEVQATLEKQAKERQRRERIEARKAARAKDKAREQVLTKALSALKVAQNARRYYRQRVITLTEEAAKLHAKIVEAAEAFDAKNDQLVLLERKLEVARRFKRRLKTTEKLTKLEKMKKLQAQVKALEVEMVEKGFSEEQVAEMIAELTE